MSEATQQWHPDFSYPLARQDRPRRFGNRASLLGNQPLCQVLENGVGNTHDDDRKGMRGLPWPTVVLGSGCLAIAADLGAGPGGMVEEVQRHLRGMESGHAQDDPAALVDDFVRSLYTERVRPGNQTRQDPPRPPVPAQQPGRAIPAEVARLTLLAARLTRFYHLVKAERVEAPSRWANDLAAYTPAERYGGNYTQGLHEHLVLPIIEDLEALVRWFRSDTADCDRAVAQMALATLKALQLDFTPGRDTPKQVHLDQVRTVTEVAWHLLTLDTGIYPGWSDLMVGLLLQQGQPENSTLRLKRRPLFRELFDIWKTLSKWFVEPTRVSFTEAMHARPEDRPLRAQFYDTVAALLLEQTATIALHDEAVRGSATAEGAQPDKAVDFPPATAFVTSFDIELEMALWRAGRPFSVVLPVHVRQSSGGRAALAWLIGDVDPTLSGSSDLQLEKLRTGPSWEVLTSRNTFEQRRRARPIVVRLSGSPLMEPPSALALKDGFAALGMPITKNSELYPAVTIDEYTALQRSNAELVASYRHSPSADQPSASLPRDFSVGTANVPRFWLAFGAQMSDPAIRYQLFTEIFKVTNPAAAGRERTGDGSAAPGPKADTFRQPEAEMFRQVEDVAAEAPPEEAARTEKPDQPPSPFALGGLAVNHRVEDDDAGLMYWLEFSVVQADCAAFIGDLDHYRAHVEQPDRRPSLGRCPLVKGTP